MERNGVAIAAMVVGIASLLLGWMVVPGIVGGLAAIYLGVTGGSKSRRLVGRSGSGMARTGLITGVVALLVGVLVLAAVVAAGRAEGTRASPAGTTPEASSTATQAAPPDGYCDPKSIKIDPDC
ncbi:MAG: hypothetical protein R2754_09385 [Microthrixaceae bacterium]